MKKSLLGKTKDKQPEKPTTLTYRIGFSPTKEQIKDIVKEYVQLYKLITPFKNDRPRKNWIRGFMNRNKLLLKIATMIVQQENVIEDIINKHNIPPSIIWNCDESCFP